MELFHDYVRGGIEVMYEQFTDGCQTQDDYLSKTYEVMTTFKKELEGTSDDINAEEVEADETGILKSEPEMAATSIGDILAQKLGTVETTEEIKATETPVVEEKAEQKEEPAKEEPKEEAKTESAEEVVPPAPKKRGRPKKVVEAVEEKVEENQVEENN